VAISGLVAFYHAIENVPGMTRSKAAQTIPVGGVYKGSGELQVRSSDGLYILRHVTAGQAADLIAQRVCIEKRSSSGKLQHLRMNSAAVPTNNRAYKQPPLAEDAFTTGGPVSSSGKRGSSAKLDRSRASHRWTANQHPYARPGGNR
jgi:hypothetical protein